MNKKTLTIRDLIVYFFVFFLYLTGFLTMNLTSSNRLDTSFASFKQEAEEALKIKDPAHELSLIFSKERGEYYAYYNYDNSFFATNSDYLAIKDVTQVEKAPYEGFLGGEQCKIELFHEGNKRVFFALIVPNDLIISRYFLFIGTPALFCTLLISFLFGKKRLKDSFLALNSQVRKLQEVGGLEGNFDYQDSMDLLTKAVRQSRKAVEKELHEAELARAKNDFVLDSFSQALIVANGDFRIEMFNKKAAEVFKIDQQKALGADASFLNDVIKGLTKKVRLTMNAKISSLTFEKVGKEIYETAIEPLEFSWTQGEKLNGASLLLVNVTDSYNSTSMKRDFFANASHELKSPLTSILGYQELIRNGILTDPEEISKAVEKTIKDAKRMNKIIMDMLTLSSLENEQLRPVEEINVSEALDEIVNDLQLHIDHHHLHVNHIKSNLTLKMNPDDFYKLFRNIIENAVRYNKDNGEVKIEENESEGYLRVTDTGIGISEEDTSRIFERFYRVDKARSRQNGGTGLGLAIVKYVCSYYGFAIDVKSKLGEGSSFTIYLHPKK